MGDSADQVIFVAVLALRLLVPLAIPRLPLPAILAALVIDAVDQTVFQSFTNLELTGYQGYDKALDVYYLTIAYLSTIHSWSNRSAFEVARFLIYYRLVGVVLFELNDARALLLVFPNTFEYFFIFYELVRLRWEPARMTTRTVVGAAAAIWIFIKLPQEYWIHIAKLDVTDILRDHPTAGATLALSLVVLVVVARPFVVRRLPPADHRPSLVVDSDEPDVVAAGLRNGPTALRDLLDRALAEKIALVSLVSIIFAQILPDADATPLEITYGVSLLIVGNTVVSEWLARRGVGWETALRQFVAMGIVNLGIVAAAVILLPGGDGAFNVGNSLFFLLLLTLLVTLYDRFRPFMLARAVVSPA